MATTTLTGHGFDDIDKLFEDIVANFLAHGFTQIFPVLPLTGTESVVTLEASSSIDPLAATQPWRIRFETATDRLKIFVAPPTQLPDDGTVAQYDYKVLTGYVLTGTNTGDPIYYTGTRQSGMVAKYMYQGNSEDEHFIDRAGYTTLAERRAHPMSYMVTFTDRGFALAVWEPGSMEYLPSLSWLVVQRPVLNTTGVTKVDGYAPVFGLFGIQRKAELPVNSTTGPELEYVGKFVVREKDVWRPTENLDATVESEDFQQSIPKYQRVSFLEDGSYNVQFVSGLNTQRYTYPLHELDLLAYTSADVVSGGYVASITVYGEATPRKYFALPSTGEYNTQVRYLMLQAS